MTEYRIPHPWIKASVLARAYNGLVQSRIIGGMEQGIFYEKDGSWKWFVRHRPLQSEDGSEDSWGYGSPAETKREAVQVADRMAGKMGTPTAVAS